MATATHEINAPKPIIPDLEAYVAGAFEGTNPDVNVGATPNPDTAEDLIIAAIEAKAPRRLDAHERAKVGMEILFYWNRRLQERKAALRETQDALHAPLWRMG